MRLHQNNFVLYHITLEIHPFVIFRVQPGALYQELPTNRTVMQTSVLMAKYQISSCVSLVPKL